MPFKDRVKRAFRRTSSSASGSDERTTGPPPPAPIIRTTTSGSTYEIYGPGECPPSKYKGPWDQDHQDRLKAFAMRFDGFGRRRSGTSQYSPGGTRMPSRSVSRATSRGESRGPSRAGSMRSLKRRALGIASGGGGSQHHVNQVKESVHDDGDVANVGLSRQVSPDTTRNSLQLSRQTSPTLRRRPSASSWSSPLARQLTPGSARATMDSLVSKRARSNSRPQDPETVAGALEATTLNPGNHVIPEIQTPDVSSERPSPTKALTESTIKPTATEPAREESQHTIHAAQDEAPTASTVSQAQSHTSSHSDQHPTRSSSHTSESALQSLASSTHRKDSASTATAMSQHQSLSLATSQTSKNASYPVSNGATSSSFAADPMSTSPEKRSLPPLTTHSTANALSSTTTNLSNPANTNIATSPVEYDEHFTPDELAKALHSASDTGLAATFRKKTRQSFRRDSNGSGHDNVDQGLDSAHSSWSRKSGIQMKSKKKSFINLIR